MGITSILIYAGLIIGELNPSLGEYSGFILTLIGFVATIASHLLIIDRIGRRIIMIIAAGVFCICNILIVIGMLIGNPTLIFVGMLL